jgi:hypothetical protein
VGAVLVVGLALTARQAPAQWTDLPAASPPPVDSAPQGSPPIDGSQLQPVAPAPPSVNPTAPATNDTDDATNAPVAPPPPTAKPPSPPPGPPLPLRTPTAVMQVLDKVTAETLQFEAPVGRPIRYKTLVMTVRVCETRGASDPRPRPSAYVVMDTRALAVPGHEPPAPKRVFEGWMFATAPALHALEHPIYDVWLVGCSAGNPVIQ